jgi:hypothetical protein
MTRCRTGAASDGDTALSAYPQRLHGRRERDERNGQQGQVAAEPYRRGAELPCERLSVIADGLPSGDRPAALAAASVDRARYLTFSVSSVLEELANRRLIPVVAGLSPMEAADLVHAEAQFVAERVALRALADGRNIILDVSTASAQSVTSWLSALRCMPLPESSPTSA